MAEHWIPAAKALEVFKDSNAICARAHAGLIKARAASFQFGDDRHENQLVPKEFWWAEGDLALEQNWETGDFSTWLEQKHYLRAFGVSFALPGLLDMVKFEQRAVIMRSLSVAGNKDWLPASQAKRFLEERGLYAAPLIVIEHAKLGFIAARAVLSQASLVMENSFELAWNEREWDVPDWYWSDFTREGDSEQDWETGRFSGTGLSPKGLVEVWLSGLHFHRDGLDELVALLIPDAGIQASDPANRGRRPKYDWVAAANAIWGKLNRGELIPIVQADVELALIQFLSEGDNQPGESTVRPCAKAIWEEFQKP